MELVVRHQRALALRNRLALRAEELLPEPLRTALLALEPAAPRDDTCLSLRVELGPLGRVRWRLIGKNRIEGQLVGNSCRGTGHGDRSTGSDGSSDHRLDDGCDRCGPRPHAGCTLAYLPQWASLTEDFEKGLEWISAPIEPWSKIRILSPRFSAQGEEHFEMHHYVAAALGGSARLLSKKAWAWILRCTSISADELERISATAYAREELTAVIEVCDQVVERYDQALEPDLRLHVARALLSKGTTLGEQGRPTAAIEVLDEVVDRYVRAPEPELREQAARALLRKAITLGGQGQPAAAIELLNQVVDRYVRAPEPELREQAARALLSKGMMLGEQGQPEAAIEVLDELVDRYGAAPEPQLHAQVVRAQLSRGLLKAAGTMFIRQHWIALVNGLWLPALTGLVLLFIIYALSNLMGNQFRGDVQLLGTLIILLVWGAWAIVVYLQWAFTSATLTGQHVILEWGVFARDRALIALDQVQDITVTQSRLGRMLKYGVLEIHVAGVKGAEMLGYWRSPELLRLGAHVV